MRFLLATLSIALLTLAATWVLPWWTLAIVAFAVCFFARPRHAFWAGFLGVFLLWLAVGLIRDIPNEHILSTRMAGVLPLGGQWILFLLVSAIIGGIVAGFAAWTGVAFANLLSPRVANARTSRLMA